MSILIVEHRIELGQFWRRHLLRMGQSVHLATNTMAAEEILHSHTFDVVILNLTLKGGCALGLADLISVISPSSRIIFVTNTTFFSDGSIFSHCANAAAFVQSDTSPDDLAALADHYSTADPEKQPIARAETTDPVQD